MDLDRVIFIWAMMGNCMSNNKKGNKLKNEKTEIKLYQYKGGGYDGCFWEWNFFLMNGDEFEDIFSSGRNGITDKDEAKDLVANSYRDDSVYVYNLTKEDDINEFQNENISQNVGRVCDAVNTILKKEVMFFNCSYCEEKIYPMNYDEYPSYFHDPDNYAGNGGIGVVMHSVICESCYCRTCDSCGCIIAGPDIESHYIEDEDKDLCEYCFEGYKKENGLVENEED
jgi:hypothetical protein